MFKHTLLAAMILGGTVVYAPAHAALLAPMSSANDASRIGFQRGTLRTNGGLRTQLSGFELDGGGTFAGGYGLSDAHISFRHGSSTHLFSGRLELGLGFSPLPHLAIAPMLAGQYDVYGAQGKAFLLLRGGAGLKVMVNAGPLIVTLSDIQGHIGKAYNNSAAAYGGPWDRKALRIGWRFTPYFGVYAKYSRNRFQLNGQTISGPVETVGIRLG